MDEIGITCNKEERYGYLAQALLVQPLTNQIAKAFNTADFCLAGYITGFRRR